MKTRFESWIAIIGLTATTLACGTAGPTATTIPAGTDTQGIAAASGRVGGSRIEPESCPGELALYDVSPTKGSITMEASFVTAKAQKAFCFVPTFTIKPEATLTEVRFNPHQVIVSGKAGSYMLTATVGNESVSASVVLN